MGPALTRLGRSRPKLAFALASLLDRTCAPLGLCRPTSFRRAAMYLGNFNPGAADPYPHVIERFSLDQLPAPAVLVSTHLGAVEAVGAMLQRLPPPVVAFVDRPWPPRGHVQRLSLEADEWARVTAMHAALGTLASGGYVFLVADGLGLARVEAPLLKGRVQLAVGAFELARRADVPVVPVMTCWRGRRVEITTAAAIAPGELQAMGSAFGVAISRWLEELDDAALLAEAIRWSSTPAPVGRAARRDGSSRSRFGGSFPGA